MAEKSSIIQKIVSIFVKNHEEQFPADFAIIDWSQPALETGAKGNRNKIIFRYTKNWKTGEIEQKKYRYSPEQAYTLEQIHLLPIFDKTKEDIRFPVFTKSLPGEIQFETRA